MNRRQFFGMTAAAVAAAGLPMLVLPQKTIFLPPQHGWFPHRLGDGYMREVEQYIINHDCMLYRYDAVGVDLWGCEQQFSLGSMRPDADMARQIIGDVFADKGLRAIRPMEGAQFKLRLPSHTELARYV